MSYSASGSVQINESPSSQIFQSASKIGFGTPTSAATSSQGESTTQTRPLSALDVHTSTHVDELIRRGMIDRMTAVTCLIDEARHNENVRRFLYALLNVERKKSMAAQRQA